MSKATIQADLARDTDLTRIDVHLGPESYPILVGHGLLGKTGVFAELVRCGKICVVSNTTVAPLFLDSLLPHLPNRACTPFLLPDGEAYKTLHHWQMLLDHLAVQGLRRDDALLALGGGVVGDMTGFAAACYMRGIDFYQAPTTLLAQVDAAVGGKTGVNHEAGKNLIGAFHQPRAVLIDTDTLASLPEREYNAGLAEVIKYGVLGDAALFFWLEDHIDAIRGRQREAVTHLIAACCRNKAALVASDAREHGVRALLNLGHSFAHAIETTSEYSALLHGEAVAIGMLCAARLSANLGYCDVSIEKRLCNLLTHFDLPTVIPGTLHHEQLLGAMGLDKKARVDGLHLVLVKQIGNAFMLTDPPTAALITCLRAMGADG